MNYAISRPAEGVLINPPEFILDEENKKVMLFGSQQAAKDFLIEHGYPAKNIEEDIANGWLNIDKYEEDE